MKYVCQICGYIYDEDKEVVPFEQLPDSWNCPLCGAPKMAFEGEKSVEKIVEDVKEKVDDSHAELSVGQLAALCFNLARGCEKQYKDKEAASFRELGAYFESVTPSIDDASVERVASMLNDDINEYPSVRATADNNSDRGAARVCVWGEKVTRMLSMLTERYLKEGEAMLKDTNIWVCTVCGFVYVGDNAPDLCPVCKVPDWKFEKVEGK